VSLEKQIAVVELQARANGLNATLREVRAKFGKFADDVGGMMRRGWSSAFGKGKEKKGPQEGFLRGAGKHAVGNLMASGFERALGAVGNIAKGTLDFEEKLTRLQIQANETPETMRAFATSVREASDATGIGKDKILDGANAFVTLTGKMSIARESAATFAKVAQATGSEVNDIATTGAAAFQNLGIEAKDFEQFFSGMTAQGKMGAVELKDLATELSTIAPQWAQFGSGKGLQGARELGAALQIVKRGFGGDAAETVTGLNNFLTAVTKKSARFRDAGVASFFNVKGGKKELKSVFEIVDLISKSRISKDPEALTKALGSSEAYRAFIQLRDGRKDMQGFVDAAMDGSVIQRDFNTYMESSAGRMSKAMENVKNAIAAAFTPERITAFANAIEGLADNLGPVTDFLGLAADVLGGISGVGKSVRGALSGDVNPFGQNFILDDDKIFTAQGKLVDKSSAEGKAQLEQRRGFGSAVDEIMGKERNERTTKDSIRAAVYASGSENIGRATAGNRYLANVFSSGTEVAEAKEKVFAEDFEKMKKGLLDGLTPLLQQIAQNTGADKEIKVGAEPVVKATKNAPSHRGRVSK